MTLTTEPYPARNRPLWAPSAARVAGANLTRFIQAVDADWNHRILDYETLYHFSVDHPEQFWATLWRFAGVIASRRGERVAVDLDRMPGAKFFPDARLNFAENLLRRRDGREAIVFWGEDRVRRTMSAAELYDAVSRVARALRAYGVHPGDRVAGYLPNLPEAIVAAIGAASVGAVWSSCSPDFGVPGVLDRFGQIAPKVLVAADGYFYNGQSTIGSTTSTRSGRRSRRRASRPHPVHQPRIVAARPEGHYLA